MSLSVCNSDLCFGFERLTTARAANDKHHCIFLTGTAQRSTFTIVEPLVVQPLFHPSSRARKANPQQPVHRETRRNSVRIA
jgi:hypothetical protein